MVLFRPLIEWVSWATLGQGTLVYHLHFFFFLLLFLVKRCLKCVSSVYVCMRMSTCHNRACKSQRATFRSLFSPSIINTPAPHTHILCFLLCPHVCPCTTCVQFPRRLEGPEEGVVSSGGAVSPALVSPSGSSGWLQVPFPGESACWPQIGFLSLLF